MKFFVLLLASVVSLEAQNTFASGQSARFVIGQSTFSATASDLTIKVNGQDRVLTGALGGPSGLAFANGSLFVVDSNAIGALPIDNRVLIYRNLYANGRYNPPVNDFLQAVDSLCPSCLISADVVLGQPDFTTVTRGLTAKNLRTPTGIATDGTRLVVADTDNNRVLIWNSIPASIQQPADLVLGQTSFTTNANATTQSGLRGPQGVWIQGDRLFVADTANDRVLIWNTFPTANGKPADVVLGATSFTAVPPAIQTDVAASASNLASPVSVTSDGTRLFVSDLGHNRVLIWNQIPTANGAAANVVIGQPNFSGSLANNVAPLCPSIGTDDKTKKPIYSPLCGATLNFPRFALSNGQSLFIADGGNDRVLVYNSIPTSNSASADFVLGQTGDQTNTNSTSFDPNQPFSPNAIQAPNSLAWDPQTSSLFVSDPYNRRVVVFSPGIPSVTLEGVRNAASLAEFANAVVSLGGTITVGEAATVTIAGTDYKYTVVKDDTLAKVVNNLVTAINSKADPNVIAVSNSGAAQLVLVARKPGTTGPSLTAGVAAASSTTAVTLTIAASSFLGGGLASQIAPGTLISIFGENLSDQTLSADLSRTLPFRLGNVQVLIDGLPTPLISVSPTQINAQAGTYVGDRSAIVVTVQSKLAGGLLTTTPIAVPILPQKPGIFALPGDEPRQGRAVHGGSRSSATVSIDGTITANNTATIGIGTRNYTYTVKTGDTLNTVRDNLVTQINANSDEVVTASIGGQFARVVLTAKAAGPEGDGIGVTGSTSASATVTVTSYQGATCCANADGAVVSPDNPALPNETILVYATGLGALVNSAARDQQATPDTGSPYQGDPNAVSAAAEVNATMGTNSTAQVITAGLVPNTVGIYQVALIIPSTLSPNLFTQLYIGQSFYISNIVTIPVGSR